MNYEMLHNREKYPQTSSSTYKHSPAQRARGYPTRRPAKHSESYLQIVQIMQGAKRRCTASGGTHWKNYGGRGIQFLFQNAYAAADWIVAHIGYRPSPTFSIDRIDNNRHYEPGNLRWATRSEQARNKQAYNGSAYGHRMQDLLRARPDYTYEGLRKYILAGWSDEQILQLRKPKGGRPRKVRNETASV
jgi:hypothetical protein